MSRFRLTDTVTHVDALLTPAEVRDYLIGTSADPWLTEIDARNVRRAVAVRTR